MGVEAALFVLRMRVTLLAEQEASADDGGNRTGIERLSHTLDIDDSTGDENRNLHRGANLVEQLERWSRPADVAASLNTLRDHRIRSRLGCRLRLVDRAALVNPGRSGKPSRNAPKCHNHVSGSGRLHIAGTHERQQQIHSNRPSSQPARRCHLGSNRSTRASDCPETTSLRNRCRKLETRNGTHAGLNNRHIQPAQIKNRGHGT